MKNKTRSSATEDIDLTETISKEASTEDDPAFKQFGNHKKIAKLMSNPKFCESLNEYLIHYQENQMSNLLLFWTNLIRLKEISVSKINKKIEMFNMKITFKLKINKFTRL